MSNILPQSAQKEVGRFYRNRLVLSSGLVLLSGAAIAALSFLPGFLMSRVERSALREVSQATSVVSEREGSDLEGERVEILRAHAFIGQFLPYASSSASVHDAIQAALSVRPAGISIETIAYTRANQEGGSSTLVLSGNSSSRGSINAYRTALIELNRFASVVVPVGALAGTEGGAFSVTLTGVF